MNSPFNTGLQVPLPNPASVFSSPNCGIQENLVTKTDKIEIGKKNVESAIGTLASAVDRLFSSTATANPCGPSAPNPPKSVLDTLIELPKWLEEVASAICREAERVRSLNG